ncbi:MAG: hypothetical protein Q9216_000920 [Gyalolechia sp. 2 TL-2023]
MPPDISASQLGRAVLDSVQNGTYPDSEDIISADFPSSAFSQALELLDDARGEIKTRIRTSSKESAPDIDGWISQAKQLHGDIETAQRTSRDIILKAERDDKFRQSVHDAGSKLRLLEEEVAFNESLAATLEQVKRGRHQTDKIQSMLAQGGLFEAVTLCVENDTFLASIQSGRNVRAIAVLQNEGTEMRHGIIRGLTQKWYDVVQINDQTSTVSLSENAESLSIIASAMRQFGLLEGFVAGLAEKVKHTIIEPRLALGAEMLDRLLVTENNRMTLSEASSASNMLQLFSDLAAFMEFLQTRLPPLISNPLSEALGPDLVMNLIAIRLSSAVPEELAALRDFGSVREEVSRFASTMLSYGWPGVDQLRSWTNSIPEAWLEKRQRNSLDKVRQLLKRGFGEISTVERVETQVVSQQDRLFAGNTSNDDWNAGWSDEEDRSPVEKKVKSQDASRDDDEEDGSAWGLDDAEEPEDDAWGWGDDKGDGKSPETPQREKISLPEATVNGNSTSGQKSKREVTLRETYNITSLPIGILDLVNTILADRDAIEEHSSGILSMAAAIPGLSSLARLLLVMYRACASNYYSLNNSGNMFLYNDCLWLVDQLRKGMQTRKQNRERPSNSRPHFDTDIVILEAFGKRCYGKEMESQRTIIKDLLDGAQGFANCTEAPFSRECDLAVVTIVDRLRTIHGQWKSILSHSALMQSIGSLLSTITDKIIIDIEDMSDISEPESQRLTAYCGQIIALEDLFLPRQEPASSGQQEEPVPLTAVYAPGWFKFQYLSEILDSSLVDIKYLWTDGGLKLEYGAEEVVELIEALFADSEHRRRAIGEIRRSSGR